MHNLNYVITINVNSKRNSVTVSVVNIDKHLSLILFRIKFPPNKQWIFIYDLKIVTSNNAPM